MEHIFFNSVESVIRTIIITILAYVLLIVFLRISGKRTLSKMNAFDFIITIALGSILATVILSKSVALFDGLLAFFLLIFFQYLITKLSYKYSKINDLVKSTPALLVYKGEMIENLMRKERITPDEIYSVLRENGLNTLSEADAVILESNGKLTVVKKVETLNTPVFNKVIKP